MEVNQLENSFKTKIESCYILSGDAVYYTDKALGIFRNLIQDDLKDFNYAEYTGCMCVDEVFIALETVPMLSQFRMVVWDIDLPNADLIKAITKKIKDYLASDNNSSILVIRDKESKLSGVFKLVTVISCKEVFGFNATSEAQNIMTEHGMKGDGLAVKELLERCNGNFSIFVSELNKIKQFTDTNIIDIPIIDKCVSRSISYSVFKISDNIVKGNTNKVFEIVKDLMSRQEAPLAILGALTKFFRQCFYLKISKMYKEEFISTFAIKEFQFTKLVSAVENYRPTELKNILEMLENIEFKIKSGVMSPIDAINMATIRLTIK